MAGAAEVLELEQRNEMEEVRAWAIDQVKNRGVAVSLLARETGYSHSLVSQFLNGGKQSPGLIAKLKELKERSEAQRQPLLEVAAAASAAGRELPLLETEDFRQVLGLCAMCLADGEIGVVTGPPGSGKTTALQEFCRRQPAVYIKADVTMSGRDLMLELGEALGVTGIGGTVGQMKRRIVRQLVDDPRLVVIDECDLLVTRNSVAKLEAVRAIWDEAHTGMVFCGLPRLATFLVKGPGGRENLSQLYSRVRRAYAMKGVSREEVRRMLAGYPLTEGARDYLVAAAVNRSQGGLRRFARLLSNTLDLVEPGESIGLEVVREADGMLVSPRTLGLEF